MLMPRLLRKLVWGLLFLALLVGIDQTLLHVSMDVPGLAELGEFYRDFRSRLFRLGRTDQAPSSEAVAERPAPAAPLPPGEPPSPRYLYVDDRGELHFADTLEEIPPAFRREAQPLNQ